MVPSERSRVGAGRSCPPTSFPRPVKHKAVAALPKIRGGHFQARLHRQQPPAPAQAQLDTVGHPDLQLPLGPMTPQCQRGHVGVTGTPAARSPPTHARQCSSRTPTSSPTRLSPGGCVRCRHTARSSCPRVWNTTSCAPQLVTLSPVTCGDSRGHRCGQGCPGRGERGHGVGNAVWLRCHGEHSGDRVVGTA